MADSAAKILFWIQVLSDLYYATQGCCPCLDVTYQIRFTNNWSKQNHPKDFPDQVKSLIHWSNIIGATHDATYRIWSRGQLASVGVKNVCEFGLVTTVGQELARLKETGEVSDTFKTEGIWYREPVGLEQPRVAEIVAEPGHSLLSFLTMLGPSPDWCVGRDSLDLCQQDTCTWLEHQRMKLFPWDAGTDSGVSFMSANQPTVPQETIKDINNTYPPNPSSPFYSHTPMKPMAFVEISQLSTKSRTCAKKPAVQNECQVTSWGPWSHCSATCGFATRHRQRRLAADQSNTPACRDRELNQTSSCAGTPGYRPNCELPSDVCSVTNWSEWSPCSAECGQGTQTRTRLHMRREDSSNTCRRTLSETAVCQAPVLDCQRYRQEKDYFAICRLPRVGGPCRARIPRWYFDSESTDCRQFVYGGCKGNENRFRSREACLEQCLPTVRENQGGTGTPRSADCQVSAWSGWSQCTVTCGSRGVRQRDRVVIRPAGQGGKSCPAKLTKLKPCPQAPCPGSPCTWSDWAEWTPCNHVTCLQRRIRNGRPKRGHHARGRCGQRIQRRHCYEGPCEIYED